MIRGNRARNSERKNGTLRGALRALEKPLHISLSEPLRPVAPTVRPNGITDREKLFSNSLCIS